MTNPDLQTKIENLEFRIVRLTELMDVSFAKARNALAVLEKANERQAVTIIELRQQVTDAVAGIAWRDAEIGCLKTANQSLSREKEHLLVQQYRAGAA